MSNSFINPILKKEMRVGARTFKFPLALMLYSLFMTGVAMLVMLLGAGMKTEVDYQVFTSAFPIVSCIELVMLCLIMPVLTASSISGEREKQTLDIMLTTPVSPLTIMLGKLLASLSQLMMFIICSIPALAVCFIYGGLKWSYLVVFFVQMLLIGFFIGSLGILCSSLFRKTMVSIIMTMLLECAFTVLPLLVIGGTYLFKYYTMIHKDMDLSVVDLYMGAVPAVVLLDPVVGFAHTLTRVCYGNDVVVSLVLHGGPYSNLYKSSPWLANLGTIWSWIHPLICIGLGMLFLYLAGRTIDQARRNNYRLSKEESQ